MLKRTLASCLLAVAPLVWAQNAIVGEVLEVQNVEGYSYLRLKTAQGDTWAAVPTAKVKKGDKVSVAEPMVMNNFESKALKRKFDKVVFGTLGGDKAVAAAQPAGPKAGPHALPPKGAEAPDAKVAKASGPEARTVGEIMAGPDALKEKTVLVRAKIVKINSGIQGLNWVHLRDGSGSAASGTNDLIVTTKEELRVGDIVTMKGVVRTDKNLGSGYVYKVLVEEGKTQK